jgi:PAS domain S-box-containing protein
MNNDLQLSFAILDTLKKGIAIFQKNEVVKLNSEFKRLFRLEENTGFDIKSFLNEDSQIMITHPENVIVSDLVSPKIKIKKQETFDNEIWQITDNVNGECWYGRFRADVIYLGGESYYILYVVDVSENYLLKTKLENETRFFYELINALPIMISIYDPDQNLFNINDALERITGWTKKDIDSKSLMELAYPDPEYRKHISEYMRSLKPGFKDITMRTKDGRDIQTSWANVKLSDNRQVGIGLDINKQRIAERRLKESEERFRNLADNISQLAWIAGRKGSILWFNKRWYDFTGKDFEETGGRRFTNLIHPEHRKRVSRYYYECIYHGKIWEDSFPIMDKKNKYKWFLSRALPIKNKEGKIKSWFGTHTDITQLKKLQDDLMIASEKAENAVIMQKRFIQNISHEVRTPMNSILGFAELMAKTLKESNEKEYLHSIQYNGKQLLTLIDDILDYSRLDSNDLKLNYESVHLDKVFAELEHQFEGLSLHFKKTNLKLRLSINPEDRNYTLYTDKHRLQQVLNNLISNAVKYTNEGEIEVGYKLQDKENRILFFVKDTGRGIDEKFTELIFNRFQQTDSTHFQGTGLGLAISKQLVHLFGGKIWFDSELNKGSSFYFSHPDEKRTGKSQESDHKEKAKAEQPNLSGKKILVAEDDEYSFKLLETMLNMTGAEVLHASDGNRAVEIFHNSKIDLVFLDIRLPGLDGYEILDSIRKENNTVPVIAQTAYAMPEDKLKSRKSGFDSHITKPISLNKLFIILNTYLS